MLPYWPAESKNKMFGGNSNWRALSGSPINLLLIQSLLTYDSSSGTRSPSNILQDSGTEVTLAEGGRGHRSEADQHLRWVTMAAGWCSAATTTSKTMRTGGTWSRSTSTSMVTTGMAAGDASNRVDGNGGDPDATTGHFRETRAASRRV